MQINFFPISFSFDNFQITRIPYNEETLLSLRERLNRTHSFFRYGDCIYVSNYSSDSDINIGETVTLNLYDNSEIVQSLIKHIFFRTFKDRFVTYLPVDFYPFRFHSAKDQHDLLTNILPNHLKGRIRYTKLFEVQLRNVQIRNNSEYGFVINVKRSWIFDKTCATLAFENFDLIGMEVLYLEELPGMQNVLAPNEEYVGKIVSFDSEFAIVLTNNGEVSYKLNQLTIRKTKQNIFKYIEFSASRGVAETVMNVIESKKGEISSAKNLYAEISKTAKLLFYNIGTNIPVNFENRDGFTFTVDWNYFNISNSIPLRTPTFIFDYAATKTNGTSADIGLTNFGPYDSTTFNPKSPYFVCICHRENRGHFTDFLASLKDGMPESAYFKRGLQKKYELQEVRIEIKEISDFSFEEYSKILKNVDNKPDLAIVEIPASFREKQDNENPYFQLKAKLLSLEIPVQYVQSEKVKSYNEFILNSLALQIYAKLGGTPWVLPSQRSVDREIIIGIGHSWLRENQAKGATQFRIVGITTFLSSDGQYLLADKVKEVEFENYFEELLTSLRGSFSRLEKEQGWQENDTIRLIFHIFKPIKNTEFEVISAFIKETNRYRIKFAFVTIGKSPYLLFEPSNSALAKGAFIPNRASNIILDSETCLVQMYGPRELKTAKQGMSVPLQIKLRTPMGNMDTEFLREELYYDLGSIVQQIYSFTYLSWRNFLPSEQPATMLYSNLISKLLGKMRGVQGWDSDHLNYSLKTKKWFL